MTTGAIVNISGAQNFTGRVLIATEYAMIVAVAEDRSVTLRRDPASTTPEQWRYGKLPVNVRPVAQRPANFADRLAALERHTRRHDQ